MKKLPVGISTLAKIVDNDCAYVDKTQHIHRLVHSGGGYYFLSRPRRFGKSLLIDTLKQAFLGNKALFKGLYLENHWDWEISYPVIHLNFGTSSSFLSKERFFTELDNSFELCAAEYGVKLYQHDYGAKFGELIRKLKEKSSQKVVVLVDEYDKPILDNIHNAALSMEMREILKGLYAYIKQNDAYLKFAMLTGVSKFSKISLFSDLNILNDISLDGRYADICGINQAELEIAFKAHLDHGNVDRVLLKKWYNGYNFTGSEAQKVYNPFDILLFIDGNYRYQNYWFATATPTFLIKMIEKNRYFIPDLEHVVIGEKALSTFDIDNMPIITLLFQTGYLTIKSMTTIGTQLAYVLSYPNLEVKASLNDSLLEIAGSADVKNSNVAHLGEILLHNQFDRLITIFSSHFASIPHDWYRNNHIDQYEGFYASIVYSFLAALGYDLIAEDVSNHGRIDLTLIMPDKILIIEFKLTKFGSAQDAIDQIKSRQYPQKYTMHGKALHLIGMSFDPISRNVVDLQVVRYED